MSLFRTKPIVHAPSALRRCLTATDLTLLGIGAIIGAGIFVLTGIAAATKAGPAIMFSYIFAGIACAFTALSYAELAATVGGCGSAYGYAYAGLGEYAAWLVGWTLLLEYAIACSAVAMGWSSYVNNFLTAVGVNLPHAITSCPFDGGVVNLPAMLVVAAITGLLCVGVRQSTRFNALMVLIKVSAIAVFVAIAAFNVQPANWHPFLPFGWGGVVKGAAIIFFGYIGFDAVSTAAEEAINPQRDLPIGIMASLAICTLVYVLVSGLLTGVASYTTLNVSSPVAAALLGKGFAVGAAIISIGAIAGLTTVILVMFYGLTRIALAMSRDGLLPAKLADVNPRTQTPIPTIIACGIVMALVAGFTTLNEVSQLVNIGTLAAFAVVCLGVLILRYTKPNLPRPFRTPFSPVVPLLGIACCVYLMFNLPLNTWLWFLAWILVGQVVYFKFGRHHSLLAPGNAVAAASTK